MNFLWMIRFVDYPIDHEKRLFLKPLENYRLPNNTLDNSSKSILPNFNFFFVHFFKLNENTILNVHKYTCNYTLNAIIF